MINPQSRLSQLRNTLLFKGFSDEDAGQLVDAAAHEINQSLIDLAFDVMASVQQAGLASKAKTFIDDLMLDISPVDISVRTQSGRTDYSSPPYSMLPSLLKNAKVAKDGSLYKVIPLKEKSISAGGLIEAQIALSTINNAKREALKEQAAQGTMPSVSTGATAAAQAFFDRRKQSQSSTVKFRTVSSKQNPATQWVNPGKSADFAIEIHNANSELQQMAANIVDSIISKYEEAA